MTHYLIDMPCPLRSQVSPTGYEFSKLNIFTGDLSSAVDEIRKVVGKIKPGAFMDPDNIVQDLEEVFSRTATVRKCAALFSTEPKYFSHRWAIFICPEAYQHPMEQIEVAKQIVELANVPGMSVVLFTHSVEILRFLEAAALAGNMGVDGRVEKIIPRSLWLREEDYKGWDVRGDIWTCLDFTLNAQKHLPFKEPMKYLTKIRGELISICLEGEECPCRDGKA